MMIELLKGMLIVFGILLTATAIVILFASLVVLVRTLTVKLGKGDDKSDK